MIPTKTRTCVVIEDVTILGRPWPEIVQTTVKEIKYNFVGLLLSQSASQHDHHFIDCGD